MTWLKSLAICGCSTAFLTACASFEVFTPSAEPKPRPTLAQLDLKPVTITKSQLPGRSLESLQQGYQELVDVIEDPVLREQLGYRLADVEILLAEQQQERGINGSQGYYDDAILAYQSLLQQYPDKDANSQVMYQLSRAYDLQGQQQNSVKVLQELLASYPDHPHRDEAWFRLGEYHFSQGDHAAAIEHYSQVVDGDQQSEFVPISAYMLGWSHFKLEQYQGALKAYTTMLDVSFSEKYVSQGSNFDEQYIDYSQFIETLPKGQLKLVKDTLRIMALLFSYAGNAEGIEDFFSSVGARPFEHLIYDELAQQHLNNDRYRDSADVLRAFTRLYPQHPLSVSFFVRHIDAYILGDFPSLVLPAKEDFVETFGVSGAFSTGLIEDSQHPARPYLHSYLKELAQFEHSFAQQLKDALTDPNLEQNKQSKLSLQQSTAYIQAARWYREFMQTFPADEEIMDMHFYLAEALFEAGDFDQAAKEYTAFSVAYPEHHSSADAAYSAILAVQMLSSVAPDEKAQRLLTVQKDFVDRFAKDTRAIPVVEQLMHHYFDQDAYQQASSWSRWLLDTQFVEGTQHDASKLHADARLILAHSQYALEDFPQAEVQYRQLLANTEQLKLLASVISNAQVQERLAASIYKQAESAIQQGELLAGISHLQRVIADTPDADLRVAAQFDAATHFLTLNKWPEAISQLLDFQQRFASHSLSADIPEKLLFAYEQSGQWLDAANLLNSRWLDNKKSESGREALLVAAEYYLKAEQSQRALESYRTYAHSYPEPFPEAMEARFIMSEFYRESGEKWKRDFWLKKNHCRGCKSCRNPHRPFQIPGRHGPVVICFRCVKKV